MNGNNSNRSASSLSDAEHLACLLVTPGADVERTRKNSAPPGSSMEAIVERRAVRSSRFNLGGGRKSDSPTSSKKKKERQASFDKKSSLDK